jgi:hypothetical protein
MNRMMAASLGVLAFVSTLAISTSEAQAQRGYGGARVAGGYRGGVGIRRGAGYGGHVYGPRYGGYGAYGGYRGGYGGYYGPRFGGYYGGGYYGGTRVYGGYYGGVYAPRVYVTGPVLAPPYPVYVAPSPYIATVPVVAPPPTVIAPAPILTAAPPQTIWGLGVRGLFVGESASKAGGIGGHLRLRSGRWLGFELSADYVRVDVEKTARQDVPLMAAMLVYLTPGRLAPYLLVGGGVNFANAKNANGLNDSATQAAAQAGGGLELRLGRHLGLNADIRYIYRNRIGGGESTGTVRTIGNEQGAQIVVGGTWYF